MVLLNPPLACIFSAILYKNSLTGVSPPASFLYNLTKNQFSAKYYFLHK